MTHSSVHYCVATGPLGVYGGVLHWDFSSVFSGYYGEASVDVAGSVPSRGPSVRLQLGEIGGGVMGVCLVYNIMWRRERSEQPFVLLFFN